VVTDGHGLERSGGRLAFTARKRLRGSGVG
jgi:hypothetical protein